MPGDGTKSEKNKSPNQQVNLKGIKFYRERPFWFKYLIRKLEAIFLGEWFGNYFIAAGKLARLCFRPLEDGKTLNTLNCAKLISTALILLQQRKAHPLRSSWP